MDGWVLYALEVDCSSLVAGTPPAIGHIERIDERGAAPADDRAATRIADVWQPESSEYLRGEFVGVPCR